jgi:hypothetical protein
MKRTARLAGWVLTLVVLVSACNAGDVQYRAILVGLNEPRGMWLLTDGTLCVAEAGSLADGQEIREGPTANRSNTGSVSCVGPSGDQTRVAEGFQGSPTFSTMSPASQPVLPTWPR